MLKPVTVGRYDENIAEVVRLPPGEDQGFGVPSQYVGWVETPDWILFEQEDGTLTIYTDRTKSGAVEGEPTVIRPRA